MSEAKSAIKMNLFIMLVAVIVFTILEFHIYTNDFAVKFYVFFPINAIVLKEYIKTISSGIFTGAFATFMINISTYNVKKTSAIKEFLEEIYEFLIIIYKDLKILEIDLPLQVVLQYYDDNNMDIFSEFEQDMSQNSIAEKEIKQYILGKDTSITNKKIDDIFRDKMDKLDQRIYEVKEQYIRLVTSPMLKTNLEKIERAFDNLDFLFSNKYSTYKDIKNSHFCIYEKIVDFKRLFGDEKNQINKCALVKHIFDIQQSLIRKVKRRDALYESKSIILINCKETEKFEYFVVKSYWYSTDVKLYKSIKKYYTKERNEPEETDELYRIKSISKDVTV